MIFIAGLFSLKTGGSPASTFFPTKKTTRKELGKTSLAQKTELVKTTGEDIKISKKSGNQSINSPKYGLVKRKLVKRSWNRSNIAQNTAIE